MKRLFVRAPTWVKVAVPSVAVVVAIGGLGLLGSRIGNNTVSIDEINRQRTDAAVAACRAVQHTNALWDNLVAVLETRTRAQDPQVVDFIAKVRRIEADTHLCDLAARRVGHPIRPFPVGQLPDNR